MKRRIVMYYRYFRMDREEKYIKEKLRDIEERMRWSNTYIITFS